MDSEMSRLVKQPWLHVPSVYHVVVTSDDGNKSKIEVSADWCIAIEYWRLSSIRVIFVDYQTSELQCNYQSYIQIESIGDAQGFSGKTPIIPSEGFSVATLIGVTPLWKTKLNRSISAIEDGISRGLQHYYKTCCEKGSHCGRQAYQANHYGSLAEKKNTTLLSTNGRYTSKHQTTREEISLT